MTIAIIQNDPLVPPGLVVEAVEQSGHPWCIIDAHGGDPLPSPAAIAGTVVLGGTMCALDTDRHPFLQTVKAFMAEGLRTDLPILGICLGGQILAEVAGGRIHRHRNSEKGILKIQTTGGHAHLFAGLPPEFTSFLWHDDAFDPPPGAPVLARTATCPHQAFQAGPHTYGLQFHPEVTREIVATWSENAGGQPEYLDSLEQNWPAYQTASRMLLGNFLNHLSPT